MVKQPGGGISMVKLILGENNLCNSAFPLRIGLYVIVKLTEKKSHFTGECQ